jgi:hypothetical protein
MRKLYTGTIINVGTFTLTLRVGASILCLEQARLMGPGRVVRFSAELDDRTECLSKPRFVVSSQVGLQAVQVTDAL